MRDDVRVDAELGEREPAALAVDDHPVETPKKLPPQIALVSGASREQVVRREHGGRPRTEHDAVELWRCKPLHVQHVRPAA